MSKNRKVTSFIKIFCILALAVLLGVSIKWFFNKDISDREYSPSVFSKIFHNGVPQSFDVDLVYLWCDGNEPAFLERKNYWLKQENKEPSIQAAADGRFEQVEELRYSLRSVEKYLPWVRHIYIVTDRQVPSWLNTQHPKLSVVDHSDIIPSQYIPVFNSNAIESVLYKIPGLAEHFLYANDDTFVNRPLTKDFFFQNGKPIVRMKYTKLNTDSLYHLQLANVIELSEKNFSSEIPFFSERNIVPHHNIDAYLKSDYAASAKHYEKEFQETLTHRFRKATSTQRLIVSIWSVMKKHAVVKIVESRNEKASGIDSLYIVNTKRNYEKMLSRMNPRLFCINDSEFSGPRDRKYMKEFLEKHFPQKSKFEL